MEMIAHSLEVAPYSRTLTRNFSIELAGLEDAPTLGRIHAYSWCAAYRGIATREYLADFTPEKRTAFFTRILPRTKNEHYLLHWNEQPVGMLAIGPAGDESLQHDNCAEIVALYLLPDYYGRGIGRAAMDFAVQRLKSLGYGDIILTVLSYNLRARRFYERYGFRPDSDDEPFWMGRYVMERRYRLHNSTR